MRILHIADLHLGAKNSKLPKMHQDVLRDESLELCYNLFAKASEKFDVILVCGDLFHSKSVSSKIVDNFFLAVTKFAKPVLYVNGNHDEKLIFQSVPQNFIVLDQYNPCYKLGNFAFYSAEYTQDVDKNQNNVLLLHGNIENTQDNDFIDILPYLNKGFDYIALGHVHSIKKYKKGANVFAYSGSLFSNGFDECGEKGYIDVEIENKNLLKCDFVPLKQRTYQLIEYDISHDKSNAEIIAGVKRQLSHMQDAGKNIVRVILTGYYDESVNKSLTLLQDAMQDYFYIEFVDNSKLKLDIAQMKSEKLSLKNEFISLVEGSNLDDGMKQKIINLGIEALKGDDLSV